MALKSSLLTLCLTAFLAIADPSVAQDSFGAAVAVVGSDVIVLKPGASQGPAGAFVFEATAREWSIGQRLRIIGGVGGEGFGPSLAVGSGRLVIAAGDAEGNWGAHTYAFQAGGEWAQAGRFRLTPEVDEGPENTVVDLAAVMRILSPPTRAVALGSGGEWGAVSDGAGSGGSVRVVHILADGAIVEEAVLTPLSAEGSSAFGAALAVRPDWVFVGAPGQGGQGAVFVFRRSEGAWAQVAMLHDLELPEGSRFGAAMVLSEGGVIVGAPGANAVARFEFDTATEVWSLTARLSAPRDADGFGFALAGGAGDGSELLVGAPDTRGARGAVYRYQVATGDTSGWTRTGTLEPTASGSGFRYGASVAVGDGVAVVGAPGADGGVGRAAVFTPTALGGWGEGVWLRPGGGPERIVDGEVTCTGGQAAAFACQDVDLLAFLPTTEVGGEVGETVSDLWGWTDPLTGREYVLLGREAGAAIIDITNPSSPRYLGLIAANPSGARDLKVYENHLFFTGDGAGAHGLKVFDLTRLRDVTEAPVDFDADATYTGIASAHNLIINPESGFAFAVGASGGGNTCGGGLHMVDIREPLNPVFAGCYTDTEGLIWQGRTHDAQCVIYSGPDEEFTGREICFALNETAIRVVDVTDKDVPEPLAAASYPGLGYVHQGWLTEDQRYFFLNDELDELVGLASKTRTLIWDVADLEDPILVGEYFGPTAATDHNLYIKGDRMYQANYQAGMRVIDISDPRKPVEVGFFDTTPYEGDPAGFAGAWTVYPFFESGTVVVSSIHEGLFILRPKRPIIP